MSSRSGEAVCELLYICVTFALEMRADFLILALVVYLLSYLLCALPPRSARGSMPPSVGPLQSHRVFVRSPVGYGRRRRRRRFQAQFARFARVRRPGGAYLPASPIIRQFAIDVDA